MPFWMKYGWDRRNEGVCTCVDRDGQPMDTAKSIQFQGGFAFAYSYAYNHIEHNSEWLEAAKSTLDFIEAYCFDTSGRMFFEVTGADLPVCKRRYVLSETFAAIATLEYVIASGDHNYAVKVLKLFNDIRRFLSTPGILESKYCEYV